MSYDYVSNICPRMARFEQLLQNIYCNVDDVKLKGTTCLVFIESNKMP